VLKRAPADYRQFIDTLPSRPKTHPNQLKPEMINKIVRLRKKLNAVPRCFMLIYKKRELSQFGLVAECLKRQGLTRKGKSQMGDKG